MHINILPPSLKEAIIVKKAYPDQNKQGESFKDYFHLVGRDFQVKAEGIGKDIGEIDQQNLDNHNQNTAVLHQQIFDRSQITTPDLAGQSVFAISLAGTIVMLCVK